MTRTKSSFRPGFETLENRCVPAAFSVMQIADPVLFDNETWGNPPAARGAGENAQFSTGLKTVPPIKAFGDMQERLRVADSVLQKVHGELLRIDGANDRLHIRPALTSASHFPLPVDRTGDVRNLDSARGGHDSSWIDLDVPLFANHLNLNERAMSEVFEQHDAEDRVPRFNLIELLVRRADDVEPHLSEGINVSAGVPAFRQLKAIGDMNDKLRTATTSLRRNLATEHFEGARRLDDASSPLNNDRGAPPHLRATESSSVKISVPRS